MKIALVGVLLVAVVGAVVLLSGRGETASTNVTSAGKNEGAAEVIVEITADGFSPETITIEEGTTITFINKDNSPHRVASDDHPIHDNLPGFDSDMPLSTNESYEFTFVETGTFTYHDHLNHLDYKGTIVVTD